MSDDYEASRQARHDARNKLQADRHLLAEIEVIAERVAERVAEKAANRAVERMWNEFGVDFNDFESRNNHRRLLEYWREKMKTGASGKKLVLTSMISAGVTAAVGYVLSLLTKGHSP
jgi:hypothetical protein